MQEGNGLASRARPACLRCKQDMKVSFHQQQTAAVAAAATYYIIENNDNGMKIPLLPLLNDNTAAAEEALIGSARHSGDLPSAWPAAGHGPRGAA